MSQPTLRTRRELVADAIRRLVTYTSDLTHFGQNSVGRAIAEMQAGQASGSYRLYRALLRRFTLLASSEEFATEVAAEHGAERLADQRAKLLVVIQAHSTTVTAVTVGATDLIEVTDSTQFVAPDSIRIRSADGSDSEVRTIIAVTVGTGPGGGDELEVASLVNTYLPGTEDVRVLLRSTVLEGSFIKTSGGQDFQTLSNVTVGDLNPVLDGESFFLGLADKVLCEAVAPGASGNVDPRTVTDFTVPNTKIRGLFNPERGSGGAPEETDFDLKFRASHGPTALSQETAAWVDATARNGDIDVLRTIKTSTVAISTLAIKVLHRNGGPFSVAARATLAAYFNLRVRSFMTVTVGTVTLTSVEVYAEVQLEAGTTLRDAWKAAASRLASHMDFRKWEFGQDVEESDLLAIVTQTAGIAGVTTSSFTPAANVAVGDESLPVLVRLTLQDFATGDIENAELQVGF